MALYKIGDRVIVRSDLISGDYYYMADKSDQMDATDEMVELAGEIVTIEAMCGSYYYVIEDIDHFGWTDDMFEGLADDENLSDLTFDIETLL